MQSIIRYQKSHTKKLRQRDISLACKHIEWLLNDLEKREFQIFERQALGALKIMLQAFHQAIKTYEEQERQRTRRTDNLKQEI